MMTYRGLPLGSKVARAAKGRRGRGETQVWEEREREKDRAGITYMSPSKRL
jgi:hypothetical protein